MTAARLPFEQAENASGARMLFGAMPLTAQHSCRRLAFPLREIESGTRGGEVVMLAKDVMRKNVITVSPDMTLRQMQNLFIERRISGAPVVDAKGKLLGVISQTDLVREGRKSLADGVIPDFQRSLDAAVYYSAVRIKDAGSTKVSEMMTPAVLSADVATPIEEVAWVMLRKAIHRMFVLNRGRLAGIISSMDMLRAVVELAQAAKRRPAAGKKPRRPY